MLFFKAIVHLHIVPVDIRLLPTKYGLIVSYSIFLNHVHGFPRRDETMDYFE